ncbi:hypothetical protein C8R45DRAFT_933720 [Mycena sanguinolenta]|nr:hypothetical protein C8R45DRAFT_933720 [Mycena sanguinolenta]
MIEAGSACLHSSMMSLPQRLYEIQRSAHAVCSTFANLYPFPPPGWGAWDLITCKIYSFADTFADKQDIDCLLAGDVPPSNIPLTSKAAGGHRVMEPRNLPQNWVLKLNMDSALHDKSTPISDRKFFPLDEWKWAREWFSRNQWKPSEKVCSRDQWNPLGVIKATGFRWIPPEAIERRVETTINQCRTMPARQRAVRIHILIADLGVDFCGVCPFDAGVSHVNAMTWDVFPGVPVPDPSFSRRNDLGCFSWWQLHSLVGLSYDLCLPSSGPGSFVLPAQDRGKGSVAHLQFMISDMLAVPRYSSFLHLRNVLQNMFIILFVRKGSERVAVPVRLGSEPFSSPSLLPMFLRLELLEQIRGAQPSQIRYQSFVVHGVTPCDEFKLEYWFKY